MELNVPLPTWYVCDPGDRAGGKNANYSLVDGRSCDHRHRARAHPRYLTIRSSRRRRRRTWIVKKYAIQILHIGVSHGIDFDRRSTGSAFWRRRLLRSPHGTLVGAVRLTTGRNRKPRAASEFLAPLDAIIKTFLRLSIWATIVHDRNFSRLTPKSRSMPPLG